MGKIIKIILLFIFALFFLANAVNFGSNGNVNLRIYDDTDNERRQSNMQVNFFANYTNSTNDPIDIGSCSISFDFTGTYTSFFPMNYNITSRLWEFNRTFNYKGIHFFNVSCASTYGDISLLDNFNITNTKAKIRVDSTLDFIDYDGNPNNDDTWMCQEDLFCEYNFSANIIEPDINDILTFFYIPENTTLTNFSLTNKGILEVNVTHNADTGNKLIQLGVQDSESTPDSAKLRVEIVAVNDAPFFINLSEQEFNESELFTYIIDANDEENDIPYSFNASFISCSLVPWSNRGANCSLFNIQTYNETSGIINFTPSRYDVGTYIVNFSVTDKNKINSICSNNNIPYCNASSNIVINFTVLNVNDAPFFTYVCNNEIIGGGIEGQPFACDINATDLDELFNLTFFSDQSWFLGSITQSVTGFNASARISLIPDDIAVGNWNINVNVRDTGNIDKNFKSSGKNVLSNSSTINFFVDNRNDSVYLFPVNNIIAFQDFAYSIEVNASDNDLLIPDKSVYNELSYFSANVSWISFRQGYISGNISVNYMEFYTDPSLIGNHTINVTVHDANNFSVYSRIFNISIQGNGAPLWNPVLILTYNAIEDSLVYLNISANVTDPDGDVVSFFYQNITDFPSFFLNGTTGEIKFTPRDEDVGFQQVRIFATDGKVSVARVFNFSVANNNDNPIIDDLSEVNVSEDNSSVITLFVFDDDLLVRSKNYYNESFTYTLNIIGTNPNLFSFVEDFFIANSVRLKAEFIPRKQDVGAYNIELIVTDRGSLTATEQFILNVIEKNHPPIINFAGNLSAGADKEFYYQFDVFDIEDGNASNGKMKFNLTFLSGNPFFTINETYGFINITPTNADVGKYHLNLSVNDSGGLMNSTEFWFIVYDIPIINWISPSTEPINATENKSSMITVIGDHGVKDDLNYSFYIDNELRDSRAGRGNGAIAHIWTYTPNYTEETTCSGYRNLTLIASNPIFSSFVSKNLSVNHSNAPVIFYNAIEELDVLGDIRLNLSNYFNDYDVFDNCNNQNVSFNVVRLNSSFDVQSSGTISFSVNGWELVFSSSTNAQEYFRIEGSDMMSNASSNNFSVKIQPKVQEVPVPVPQPQVETREKPLAFKLLTSKSISVFRGGIIEIPLLLDNTYTQDLRGIDLGYYATRNNSIYDGFRMILDKSHFDSLGRGKNETVLLTVLTNDSELGRYELFVNASVKEPKYYDFAKIDIEIFERNSTHVQEVIIFVEELIVENPECLELRELLNEAKDAYNKGEFDKAVAKANEVIQACKSSLVFGARREKKDQSTIFFYIIVLSVALLFSGFIYYIIRIIIFRRRKEAG